MSAPKTNIETQKRRHIVPLIGMALVAIFGVGLIVYWQVEEAAMGDSPTTETPAEVPETDTPGEVPERSVTPGAVETAPEPSTDTE